MRAALDEARAAVDSGDVPVGAVLLDPSGTVLNRVLFLSKSRNRSPKVA